jgi:hypothetical protein
MIDPLLSLAFGLHSNKGAYALLLGSGVSRSAGITTGWEIVLDLIRKLAAMKGEDCEPDPASWYEKVFRDEPNYDTLLSAVAKLPAERSQLLRQYFEPTDADREQGLKVPTNAHKAIAKLVSSGHIRAIVTTNFDRLLEQALESIGITPTIISTPDTVEGALPLIHTTCTLVKIHGDYLDTRIKNSPAELCKYDKRLNRLLNRIFDEFGLIVSGWSAEWDEALRAALERCKTHRFGTFWTVREKTTDHAERLIKHRQAETIKIEDANSFFQQLEEKVTALDEVSKHHPLSVKIAAATLKRYIVDDRYKIALHDLVMSETERVYNELQRPKFSLSDRQIDKETVSKRIASYEALIEILVGLFATGCYWGERQHEYLWCKCLERLVNLPIGVNANEIWNRMQRYPALRLLYAGGMTCLIADHYETFAALLTRVSVRSLGEERPLVTNLYPQSVIETGVAQMLPGMERHYTPGSDRLFMTLRDALREFFPDDEVYQKTFDRFEYLRALVQGDYLEKLGKRIWGSPGCFAWRHDHLGDKSILRVLEAEASAQGPAWAPFRAGLFGEARFKIIKQGIDQMVAALNWD